ncbi:MAG: class I SAM-dependent methyltransferase [Acidobacteriia bacterium]|nr:class I SAM-dependent methyltransferase [Terriglobia bacterium]
MSLNCQGCPIAPRRGMQLFAGVLGVLLVGIPVVAQESDVHKDVPYVPTPPEVVEAMLKLGKVGAGDIHYDLGCGDGRIVIMAVQKFGAARGTGYDIDPERIKEANANAREAGVTGKVKFILGNLFDADFRDASIVTLYLLPEVNLKLRPKLLNDLKVGSRIVSHQFDMGDWKPDNEVKIDWRTIYVWTVTAKAKAEFGGK